jgi:phosphatidylserine decarboxylase
MGRKSIEGACQVTSIRKEVLPFIAIAIIVGGGNAALLYALYSTNGAIVAVIFTLIVLVYLLYFFRDPPRFTPKEPSAVFAAADGVIARIEEVSEVNQLNTRTIRISTFLSLMDVHVNRLPLSGVVRSLAYHPGKRYFTFQDKSSEYNQHSAIVVETSDFSYLIHQIVGPVARRVVYWLSRGQAVSAGEPFGLMKFGSRLDLYLPADKVEVLVKKGDRVRAGETIIARLVE